MIEVNGKELICETCRYWQEHPSNSKLQSVHRTGFCHRRSPQGELSGSLFNFPKAGPRDWCGEHSELEDLRALQSDTITPADIAAHERRVNHV